jgi:1-pyrroline-5-carboxylate dehydrogenase
MSNAVYQIRKPENAQMFDYLPGSVERADLKAKLAELKQTELEIPLIIGGKEIRTGDTGKSIIPHNKSHVLATYHKAGEKEVAMAIEAALEAKKAWLDIPWDQRLAVFLKAAEMIQDDWRYTLVAATMLCQSKTAYEADMEAAGELKDFFRFNPFFARQIFEEQPINVQDMYNRMEYRPLEGFVFAVSPFNFTAIAGNLPTSPAMVGNTTVWKPASVSIYSSYYVMKLLQAAGLPDGVINFVPGSGSVVGPAVMKHPMLAGIHFTGSTATFNEMWRTVAQNAGNYVSYPRLVGETGGKDFVFAHPTADIDALVTAIVAGAYAYQGQKCSATSRVYIPQSIWPEVKTKLLDMVATIKFGDTEDFTNYMGAIIEQKAFDSIKAYIQYARDAKEAEIIAGGECDDSVGFFIQPTVILTTDPKFKTMQEEIFGPVITVYVYADPDYNQALDLCESTSRYALTGAIFAQDRSALVEMEKRLYYSAGNLLINEKTCGMFIGLHPFGGARSSGTNEKIGKINMLRWLSPRVMKEKFNPAKDFLHPMTQES